MPSKRLLIILGVLALVVGFPAVTSFAATGASISLGYSVGTSNSTPYIDVQLTAVDSQFPSTVNVTVSAYYAGSSVPYRTVSVLVSPGPKGGVSEDFLFGYKGAGNYLFVGGVYSSKGTLLCGASIDPLIEPEWK